MSLWLDEAAAKNTQYVDGTFHTAYEARSDGCASNDPELWRALHQRRLASAGQRLHLLIQACDPAHRRLLELGSGAGSFLSLARPLFADVHGVEPNPALAAFCRRELQLSVTCGTAEAYTQSIKPGTFDTVCMFHVLEHLELPKQVLALVRETISPGGLLHIEVPNLLHNFRIANTRINRFFRDPHLHYFCRETLTAVLKGTGFEPLYVAYPRPHWLAILARASMPQRILAEGRPQAIKHYLEYWSAWSSEHQ